MSDEVPKFEFIGPPLQWQDDVVQDVLIKGNRLQVQVPREALQDANPNFQSCQLWNNLQHRVIGYWLLSCGNSSEALVKMEKFL